MMHAVLLLLAIGPTEAEYSRALDAKDLDQAAFDAETYGEKSALAREKDGLRIKPKPGDAETGWKTPQAVRFGGDFTIAATFAVKALPKPAQEDGAAVGLAIAFQDANQPDLTLVRLREPKGADVYRSIEKGGNHPNQINIAMPQPMMIARRGQGAGGNAPKPPRPTFPASGETFRIELRREGNIIRYQVSEGGSGRPRYLGQFAGGTNDVAAIKVFASNRNGAEPIDVLVRDMVIRADRITGLGTTIRTVFGATIHGEPTAIDGGDLVIGGPIRAPAAKPAAASKPVDGAIQTEAFAPLPSPKAETTKDEAQAQASPPKKAAAAAQPKEKARVPLVEVESIRFERTPSPCGRFVGQPNVDVTGPHPGPNAEKDQGKKKEKEEETKKEQEKKDKPEADDPLAPPPGTAATAAAKVPKAEPRPNGVRDLELLLANLDDAAITQVTVTCQTDKGPASWRLDTNNSQDAPLVLRRAGTEPWAGLFLEPPAGDCYQKDFTVNISYKNNRNANLTIKGGEIHTDPKRKVDPGGPIAPLPGVRVHLVGREVLFGRPDALGDDSLRLTTPWLDRVEIPLSRVIGLHFAAIDRKETRQSFAKRLEARGPEDLLLARTKSGDAVTIVGIVEGSDGDRLRFRYKGATRTLPLAQVEGIVMAARPDPRDPDGPRAAFELAGALAISGRWKDLDANTWTIETPWGRELKLPAADVKGVRFRGGRMTYLSDLTPSRVDEAPFFGRKLPWRRDASLAGGPLKIQGRSYDHGIAVHSRSLLTYDLDGRYARFEALVGFDDAAGDKGRVDCRVLADGRELYANPDLRADAAPVALSLPVAGAAQLTLAVDFGQGQDTGDRVIWAEARLDRGAGDSNRKGGR